VSPISLRALIRVLGLTLAFASSLACAATDASFSAPSGNDIPITGYPAKGDALVLWLPSESGLVDQEKAVAQGLADAGVEVWRADLFTAYFLPTLGSSMEKMPAGDVAALIEHARTVTHKRIYLLTAGRGALVALRGARAWQLAHPEAPHLGGVILLSPKLYLQTPEPGQQGRFMPVVTGSDLPVMLLQPTRSIWYWKLDRIVPALSSGGSDVYVWMLPGVRDRFYYRPDAFAAEDAMAKRLPGLIKHSLPLLDAVAAKARHPAAHLGKAAPDLAERTDRTLRVFKGNPQPPALHLDDLAGHVHDLRNYRGRVVLVNFWATWCPPCVHEMPSMQRLKDKLAGKPFTILGVNMAEEPGEVRDFLAKIVHVDFPILLDRDGAALGRWKVFAFPTNYVVDKRGRIRYAMFGAIDWDNPDVVNKIEGLLAE